MPEHSLNPAQERAASKTEGRLLVNAGAGTGKTRTVIERAARILRSGKAMPEETLCITFTNKAAQEMRERMAASGAEGAERAWVCTFHAFCLRVLRVHAGKLGYRPGFGIADGEDQKKILKKILSDKSMRGMPSPAECLSKIELWKRAGLGPGDVAESADGELWSVLYKAYQDTLMEMNLMDFGDLIANTLRLFELFPDVLDYYRNRFKYITVDEFQDSDFQQNRLVLALSGGWGNLCVVGDDCQSIYGFRGARPENILGFPRLDGVEVVSLEENYRCSKNILGCANALISNNARRLDKRLYTNLPEGAPVLVIKSPDDTAEAAEIASRVRRLHMGGVPYEDIAVLYRIKKVSKPIESAFISKGIPYALHDGGGLLETFSVMDMRAAVEMVANPENRTAADRALADMFKGFGPKLRALVEDEAVRTGKGMAEVVASGNVPGAGRMRKAVEAASAVMKGALAEARKDDARGLIEYLNSALCYEGETLRRRYKKDAAWKRQKAALDRVREIADGFRDAESGGIRGFLSALSLNDGSEDERRGVNLMTVHKAKGLEFGTVFVAGMDEGVFPSRLAVKDAGDNPHAPEIEEERRLAYVAFTRAKRSLILCCAERRDQFRSVGGGSARLVPSRFIGEVPEELTEVVDTGW